MSQRNPSVIKSHYGMETSKHDVKDDPVKETAKIAAVTAAATTTTRQMIVSKELHAFYSRHQVDFSEYPFDDCNSTKKDISSTLVPHRFVRFNPRFDFNETMKMLQKELEQHSEKNSIRENNCTSTDATATTTNKFISTSSDCSSTSKPANSNTTIQMQKVPWLNNNDVWAFYALPGYFPLSQSECFRSGRIYGMDVSSGAGVAVLMTDAYDVVSSSSAASLNDGGNSHSKRLSDTTVTVLDLCCSPGLKLCTIADYLRQTATIQHAKLVGVDISESRMALCKRIVQKYHIDPETSSSSTSTTTSTTTSTLPLLHVELNLVDNSRSMGDNDTVTINTSTPQKRIDIRLYCQDGTTFGQHCKTPSKATSRTKNMPTNMTESEKQDTTTKADCSNLVFDSVVAMEEYQQRAGKRKRMNKSAIARQQKRLRQASSIQDWMQSSNTSISTIHETSTEEIQQQPPTKTNAYSPVMQQVPLIQFDRVLVDAECSTDGSLKHSIIEQQQHQWKEKRKHSNNEIDNTLLTDETRLSKLVELQKELIMSGFNVLKPGGRMVYSTCSLSEDQNERVVRWLLDVSPQQSAYLIPIHFPLATNAGSTVTDKPGNSSCTATISSGEALSLPKQVPLGEGKIPGTVRFYPNRDPSQLFGGGFFLAKIGKRCSPTAKDH